MKKTTEELIQMRAELQAKLKPIETELADLAARQASAEPELQRIANRLLENRHAAGRLRNDPASYVLGGILGLGHKAAVKQQLNRLYAENKQLEAELEKTSEGWALGYTLMLTSIPPWGFTRIWSAQRQKIERERGKWNLDNDLASVSHELNRRLRVDAARQREANQIARQAIVRAKVAAHDGKSRDLTSTVKKSLALQRECPYCGGAIGANPHADHIYPVAKGGHSVPANMVLVCAACNLRKGTKTLRAFILEYGLCRDEIEMRLHKLGKDF